MEVLESLWFGVHWKRCLFPTELFHLETGLRHAQKFFLRVAHKRTEAQFPTCKKHFRCRQSGPIIFLIVSSEKTNSNRHLVNSVFTYLWKSQLQDYLSWRYSRNRHEKKNKPKQNKTGNARWSGNEMYSACGVWPFMTSQAWLNENMVIARHNIPLFLFITLSIIVFLSPEARSVEPFSSCQNSKTCENCLRDATCFWCDSNSTCQQNGVVYAQCTVKKRKTCSDGPDMKYPIAFLLLFGIMFVVFSVGVGTVYFKSFDYFYFACKCSLCTWDV